MRLDKKYKFLASKNAYKNKFVSIRADEYLEGEEHKTYYIIEGKPIVSVLAINSRQEVLLVQQYRPTIKQMVTGLPGGGVDTGESLKSAAAREFHEETGYAAKKLTEFTSVLLDPGQSEKSVAVFLAESIEMTGPDVINIDSEIERLVWVNLGDCFQKIQDNVINDPVAKIAIMQYLLLRK